MMLFPSRSLAFLFHLSFLFPFPQRIAARVSTAGLHSLFFRCSLRMFFRIVLSLDFAFPTFRFFAYLRWNSVCFRRSFCQQMGTSLFSIRLFWLPHFEALDYTIRFRESFPFLLIFWILFPDSSSLFRILSFRICILWTFYPFRSLIPVGFFPSGFFILFRLFYPFQTFYPVKVFPLSIGSFPDLFFPVYPYFGLFLFGISFFGSQVLSFQVLSCSGLSILSDYSFSDYSFSGCFPFLDSFLIRILSFFGLCLFRIFRFGFLPFGFFPFRMFSFGLFPFGFFLSGLFFSSWNYLSF